MIDKRQSPSTYKRFNLASWPRCGARSRPALWAQCGDRPGPVLIARGLDDPRQLAEPLFRCLDPGVQVETCVDRFEPLKGGNGWRRTAGSPGPPLLEASGWWSVMARNPHLKGSQDSLTCPVTGFAAETSGLSGNRQRTLAGQRCCLRAIRRGSRERVRDRM